MLYVYIWLAILHGDLNSVRALMKSSLTFVIDETGSMKNDINEVKKGTNAIFETVMNSNTSQIEDFVLVTFNDPDIRHRTTTRDREEFKRALEEIDVHGGGDCPEMAMAGILRALEESRPGSYLYILTDASAKDPEKYENVKRLAQKKQTQIVFALTGRCSTGNRAVYDELAHDTQGQVFHLDRKNEVGKILAYVRQQIIIRPSVLATHDFPPGSHTVDFDVDDTMKELVISVSGTRPAVRVVGPGGVAASTEPIVDMRNVAIVRVTELSAGKYTATVSSSSAQAVVVSAGTALHFRHGFSALRVPSADGTTVQPIPDETSYLSIKLDTDGSEDIRLDNVQILDIDNNLVTEEPLEIENKEEKFYISRNPILPPNKAFRVAIKGRDLANGKEITRISLTPIEPQFRAADVPDKAPIVSIVGGDRVSAEYRQHLELRCLVSGHPRPDVTWQAAEKTDLKSTLSLMELPSDYISVLRIERVASDDTYTCRAVNALGEGSKRVDVQTVQYEYFNVIKIPENATIESEQEARFDCEVDADPPANITWYRDRDRLEENENIKIETSPNGETLIIKNMRSNNTGKYICQIENVNVNQSFWFQVDISETAPPNIETVNPKRPFAGVEGDLSLRLPCAATGRPAPTITWRHATQALTSGTEWYVIEDDGTLVIKNLDKKLAGTYTCYAENKKGIDAEAFEVIVDANPAPGTPKTLVSLKEGESTTLNCDVASKTTDHVRWFKNGILLSKERTQQLTDVKISDAGIYTCRVSDLSESHSEHVNVTVGSEPKFLHPKKGTTVIYFEDGLYSDDMDCSASGLPQPEVNWWHDGVLLPVEDMAYRFTMTHKDRGIYYCLVKNEYDILFREFSVVSQDCLLNIASDLKGNQPLLTSAYSSLWPSFNSKSGYMNILSGERIRLDCPTGFENLAGKDILATCERESTFTSSTDGMKYKFSEFRCKSEIEPIPKMTRRHCLPANPNAKLVKMGYDSRKGFLEVYEVCLDTHRRTPIYTQHRISPSLANTTPDEKIKHASALVSPDKNAYDCKQDHQPSYTTLGKWFNRKDDCCFSERLLVDPRDVFPGLPQKTTYSNLNIVPHWSTCNSENWEHVGDVVRELVKSTGAELTVWSGVARPTPAVELVSRYLWKVVQNPTTKQSLAIVQLNLPDVSASEARGKMICKDICKDITWMTSDSFYDVSKGFTFCCNILDFEDAFDYHGVFDRGTGEVLK